MSATDDDAIGGESHERGDEQVQETEAEAATGPAPSEAKASSEAGMPYGSWPTPITSELVVRAAVGLGDVGFDGDVVWWSELRPEEAGRTQLVRKLPDDQPVDVLPDDANVRTAAHEYGGGAWGMDDGLVWYSGWADQRLRVLAPGSSAEPATPEVVTPQPELSRGDRWADGQLDPGGRWLLLVREHHVPGGSPADVCNELVLLDLAGELEPRVLVTGPDFVSDPRFSPDGDRLCWLQWQHPDMPWDGTELVVADVRHSGIGPGLSAPRVVAGRPNAGADAAGESVFQPRWAPDGSLWFASDRTGWWNLYRWLPDDADGLGKVEPMVQTDAEIGQPQWVFGQSRFAFLDGGRVVFAYQRDGLDHVAVRAADGSVTDLDLPYTAVGSVEASGDDVVFIGASAVAEPAVVRLRLDGTRLAEEPVDLRPPRDLGIDPAWFSVPESISFPTTALVDGQQRTAHALFYPPTNPDVPGPAGPGEKPPLLVMIHGGPTSAARPMLQMSIQYWTSRGFAVVDVNYGGSTGYGRAYRDQLQGAWGVVDLDDCEAAARWLGEQGRVDPARLAIRGGSAGGYTTLAALAFRDTFAAGASHYGVADLEALATDTHKFESRYLDGLIGPYPDARDVYVARSPIHHVAGIDRPLAVFQGLEDEVVPPNQAEMIVGALRERNVPVTYLAFEGEQHGFRKAANIRRALDGELSFYAQVFGFDLPPDEGIDPVEVENL
ncbi:MAG: prolyl oligopeptidase family serine peptidase [Acidimicrobiales bacterium]